MSASLGVAACGVSAVFFGSMFVPLKGHNAADGIFVQWVMSFAILIVGFIVFAIEGFPGFYPLAMLGGTFWTLGNATAIPIISRLGMALSILIWNTTNCLTGWASGRFGLFGMPAQPPASPALNYIGLACVIAGGFVFSRVQSEPKQSKPKSRVDTEVGEEVEKVALSSGTDSDQDSLSEDARVVAAAPAGGRPLGFTMALCAGVFYGITFVPVSYVQNNPEIFAGAPKEGLPYVFSHYFGIFLTASTIFIVYALIKRNRPIINNQIVLPSLVSGLLWAVAQSAFFVANSNLSEAVSFPIITMLPGCIASAWSILYYKEIKGRRNLSIMALAMLITITGAVLVGLSKVASI